MSTTTTATANTAAFARGAAADAKLRAACIGNDVDVVDTLLRAPPPVGVDPSLSDQHALRLASARGHVDVVRRLLADTRVDPSALDSIALRRAAAASTKATPAHALAVVRLLLADARTDPAALDNEAVRTARDADVLAALLADARTDPSARDFQVLVYATDERVVRVVLRACNARKRRETVASTRHLCSDALGLAARRAFHQAIVSGHVGVVRELASRRFTFDGVAGVAGVADSLSLVLAARHGNVDVVRLLMTTCDVVVRFGNTAAARLLLSDALLEACRNNCVRVAELLLADARTDPSRNDQLALREAASTPSSARLVQRLLRDPRVVPHPEVIGNAAASGNVSLVRLLLADARTDPSVLGNAAMERACSRGHVDVAHMLLDDARTDPSSAVRLAVRMASGFATELRVVYPSVTYGRRPTTRHAAKRALVARMLDDTRFDALLDRRQDAFGALAEQGHASLVAQLLRDRRLRRRVDPSVHENRAIRMACQFGHVDTVAVLLADARVDPSMRDQQALWCAATLPDHASAAAIVALLLRDARVDPSSPRDHGPVGVCFSPLAVACRNGNARVVALLLADTRVDPSPRDHGPGGGGFSPLAVACRNGNARVVALLLADARTDPMDANVSALRVAGTSEVAELVVRDARLVLTTSSRVTDVLVWLGKFYYEYPYVKSGAAKERSMSTALVGKFSHDDDDADDDADVLATDTDESIQLLAGMFGRHMARAVTRRARVLRRAMDALIDTRRVCRDVVDSIVCALVTARTRRRLDASTRVWAALARHARG